MNRTVMHARLVCTRTTLQAASVQDVGDQCSSSRAGGAGSLIGTWGDVLTTRGLPPW